MMYSVGGAGDGGGGANLAKFLMGVAGSGGANPAPAGTVTDANSSYAPGSAGAMAAMQNGTGVAGGNSPGQGGGLPSNYYQLGQAAAGGNKQNFTYSVGGGGGGGSY